MNKNNFATFLKELTSAQNWAELKQRANEFASAINSGSFTPSKGDVANYHFRFKNSHLNLNKESHEELFFISKDETSNGLLKMT